MIPLIVFIALCLVANAQVGTTKNSKTRTNATDQPSIPAWHDTDSYLKSLIPAAVDAAKVLAAVGDPIFAKGAAIQMQPPQPVEVLVLFVTEAGYPANMRAAAHYSPCQTLAVSKDANVRAKYVIACNPDFLRKLEILIRVAHATEYFNAAIKNDWMVMQLIKGIEIDPSAVMRDARPEIAESHIQEHMSTLLVFLLGHESWHLQHHTTSQFAEASDLLGVDLESDLESRIVCRNYDEFIRQGIQFFGQDKATPLRLEPTTQNSDDRKYFEETRATWTEEIDADRYGSEMVARMIRKMIQMVKTPDAEIGQAYLETMENFALLMLEVWQGQMRPFAEENCADKAGQDYYLTLCMCKHKDLYRRACTSSAQRILLSFFE